MDMYLPKHFKVGNWEEIASIIDDYPFATVISFDESNQPFFSHVPLVIKKSDDRVSLLGHVSKRNGQWTHFKTNPHAKVLIHGPHTYITPTWYRSGRDVPTWNYVAIHIDGRVRLIQDFDGLVNILKILTEKFEAGTKKPWEFELPEDLFTPETLTSSIVGFEIEITHIDAKFKLNQTRPGEDKTGVLEGLSERKDDMSRAIRELMEKTGV